MTIHPKLLDGRVTAEVRTSHARLPASLFRTHGLSHAERFPAWRESVGIFLDSSMPGGRDAAAFSGQIESYLLDDVVLSRVAAGAQKFDRASPRIARDSLEHYMVQVFLGGDVEMALRTRSLRAGAGRVIGFDLGDVLDSVNSEFDLLCAIIPRARLSPLLAHPDSLHASMPATESGGGALLANFFKDLFAIAPGLSPAEAVTAARAFCELIATAFNGAAFGVDDRPDVARYALLLKARLFIRDHLASSDLTPDAVAVALGLSRSALYRLFEHAGGVAEYIREQRLRRAMAELMSLHSAHLQVAEIGYRWGFADPGHFSRTFRSRFGCTPSEARSLKWAAVRRDGHEFDARVGDRRYEDWIAVIG